jgi:hypothetical protein
MAVFTVECFSIGAYFVKNINIYTNNEQFASIKKKIRIPIK